jgi:murein endopeptidase
MDCHRGGTQKKKWFRKDRYKERKISPKANIPEPPGCKVGGRGLQIIDV